MCRGGVKETRQPVDSLSSARSLAVAQAQCKRGDTGLGPWAVAVRVAGRGGDGAVD